MHFATVMQVTIAPIRRLKMLLLELIAKMMPSFAECINTSLKYTFDSYLTYYIFAEMHLVVSTNSVLFLSPTISFVAGFLGADCSVAASLPPTITGTRAGPTCDVRGPNPCSFVSIFLTQFAFTETFSCTFVRISHFQPIYK